MSQFTCISFPQDISLLDGSRQEDLFYPVVFGAVEYGEGFFDLCFRNKFHYTLGIDIPREFMGVTTPNYEQNFDKFESVENYQGLAHSIISASNCREHPKPYLLQCEKTLNAWLPERAYFQEKLHKALDSILPVGEFAEIFSEVEMSGNAHRKHPDKAAAPMLVKAIALSELLNKSSTHNLTQHLMKVKVIKD
jgi:hypothetical protein